MLVRGYSVIRAAWLILILAAGIGLATSAADASTQSVWRGNAICGGVDIETNKDMPACGYSKAKKEGKAVGECPKGSFFDIGTWSCFSCPKGFNRTGFAVDTDKACSKEIRPEYRRATSKGNHNRCPRDTFHDPRNGGECWKCPSGYDRTLAAVDAFNACGKAFASPVTAIFVSSVCPTGTFPDPNGKCYQCPEGFRRTAAAVTAHNACFRNERLEPANKEAALTCEAGQHFDFIDGGTCWSCPERSTRSVSSVKSNEACHFTNIRWDAPKRDSGALFRFPGAEGVVIDLIKERTTIEAVARDLAERGGLKGKQADDFVAESWETIRTAPHVSTVLPGAVFKRLVDAIKSRPKTDSEREMLAHMALYIQDTRKLMAYQVRDVYGSWKEWNRRKRAQNTTGLASMFDIGQQPPEFDSVSQQVLGVSALGALTIVPTLGPAVGMSTNALSKVPMFAKLVPYAGKTVTKRVVEKVAEEVAKKGIQTAMKGAGKTVAGIAKNLSSLVSGGAGPAAIIAGAAIVAGVGFDIVTANIEQQDKIASMLDKARRPVNLATLLRDDRGKEELVSNWALMVEAPASPSKSALRNIQAAFGAGAGYGGPTQIKNVEVVHLDPGGSQGSSGVTVDQGPAVIAVTDLKWNAVPGQAQDVSVGLDGKPWIITLKKAPGGFEIKTLVKGKWQKVKGGGLRIATTVDVPIIVDDKGRLLALRGITWTDLKAPVKPVDVAAFAQYIGIVGGKSGKDGYDVHVFSSNKWRKLAGAKGLRIALQPDAIWVVSRQGSLSVFPFAEGKWKNVKGPKANDIGASADQVWIVSGTGQSRSIHRRVAGKWERVSGPDARGISAHVDGTAWAVDTKGRIFAVNLE